jgi:histidinol-phosphatase
LQVERKGDGTPVTAADRQAEEYLRSRIAAGFPEDAILGEEMPERPGTSGFRWIVDPIDGTRNYSRGNPVWATLIALAEGDDIRLGVVSAPALRRRWWAERGGGAWVDGQPMHVSGVASVEDAVISLALEQPLPDLARRAWHPRGFGDFWAHMLVAEGAVDGAVDAQGVALWDVAPVQVIVEEAGGRFTDWSGEARADRGTAVSSNGALHG